MAQLLYLPTPSGNGDSLLGKDGVVVADLVESMSVGARMRRRWARSGQFFGAVVAMVSVIAAESVLCAAEQELPVAAAGDVAGLRAALHEAVTLSAAEAEAAPEAAAHTAPDDQAADDADGLSVSLDTTFNSKYVWRGLLLTDDPVFEPSISIAWKGLSVNVWGNMDLTGVNGNRGDFNEVDVSVDYSMSLVGPLGGSVGMVFYTFPNTAFNSTTEFYAGLNLDVPLSPSITAYFDVDEADGTYLTADIGHSFDLPQLADGVTWSLDLGLGFGWGSADYNRFYFGGGGSGWTDLHSSLSLPIQLGDHWTVTPSVGYHAVLDDDLRDAVANDDNVVYGISVTFSF